MANRRTLSMTDHGAREEKLRYTFYLPVSLAERLKAALERQYGQGRAPTGILTAVLTRLLESYISEAEAAERR